MTDLAGVLYSFRRCPYAIRARLAISASGITTRGVDLEVREVLLRDKPVELGSISPKATVPVLHLVNNDVIEESQEIMVWALSQCDPENWLRGWDSSQNQEILKALDGPFKKALDRYKYPGRFCNALEGAHRVDAEEEVREQALATAGSFLLQWESKLNAQAYLGGDRASAIDAAVFPFVRQFAAVNESLFVARFPTVDRWRRSWQDSERFVQVMRKTPPWTPGDVPVTFAELFGS